MTNETMLKRWTENREEFEKRTAAAMDRLMDIRNEEAKLILSKCSSSLKKLRSKKIQINALLTRSHIKRKKFIYGNRMIINPRKAATISSPVAFIQLRKYRMSYLQLSKMRSINFFQNEFDNTQSTW